MCFKLVRIREFKRTSFVLLRAQLRWTAVTETGAANMVVTKDKLVKLDFGSAKQRASRLAMAVALLSVTGCSTPDWVNPVTWFEDDEATGPIESNQPDANAEGGEYPKLGKTPPVPGQTISIAEAETIENGLRADRQNAEYTDQQLRADTAIQPLPKPKPVAPPPAPEAEETATGPEITPVPPAPVAATPLAAPVSPQTANGVKLMPQAAPVTTPEQAYARQVPGANTVVISGNGVQDVFQQQLAASAATTTTLPANTQFQSYPVAPLNNSAVTVAPIIQDTYNQPVALGYGSATGNAAGVSGVSSGSYGTPDAVLYFETGSARVGQGDMNKLRQIAQAQSASGATVKVVGHASSRTRELPLDRHKMVNLRMSQQRSTNVVQALIKLGVPSQKIIVESKSDSEPVTREAMPSDEAKNRRTEIFLVN